MKIVFYTLLTIIWMVTIYTFSSQPAIESKQTSSKYAYFICEHFLHWYDDSPVEEQEIYLQKTDHIIRKVAHFAEYAILGFFIAGIFVSREIKGKKLIKYMILAWFIATLYASSDEYHQLFVPGRSGQFLDVIIDSCGALAGFLCYFLCIKYLFGKYADNEKAP